MLTFLTSGSRLVAHLKWLLLVISPQSLVSKTYTEADVAKGGTNKTDLNEGWRKTSHTSLPLKISEKVKASTDFIFRQPIPHVLTYKYAHAVNSMKISPVDKQRRSGRQSRYKQTKAWSKR